MFIAQKLKKENIIEYLLYMWQTEDILRACMLNIDIVNEKIVVPQQLSEEQEKSLYDWYESLIEMMISEGIQQKGHLQINKNILNELIEIHEQQLAGKDAAYSAKFYHILPYVSQLKQQQADSVSDIEICFNFLYGIMLLRLQRKEISQETLKAKDEISKFMALLVKAYSQYAKGELED